MGAITTQQLREYKGPWEAYCYDPKNKEVLILRGHHSECIDALHAALLRVHERARGYLASQLGGEEASTLLVQLFTWDPSTTDGNWCFWRTAYGATWGVRIPRDVVELWLSK